MKRRDGALASDLWWGVSRGGVLALFFTLILAVSSLGLESRTVSALLVTYWASAILVGGLCGLLRPRLATRFGSFVVATIGSFMISSVLAVFAWQLPPWEWGAFGWGMQVMLSLIGGFVISTLHRDLAGGPRRS